MKCQLCNERDASIHYIEIVEGQKTSQWICPECAEREGITPADVPSLLHGGLESFLGDMLSSGHAVKSAGKKVASQVCDVCGYDYARLQATGLLGCPACYAAFRKQLLPMLRRYHGGVSHLGKLPRARGPGASLRKEIARLKLLLEQAIAQESYEEAAQLRDEIRAKEQQVARSDAPESSPPEGGTDPKGEQDE